MLSTPMRSVRRQLSLYVPPPESARLDVIRAVVDPEQHRLIPPHVTLCRESDFTTPREEEEALERLRGRAGPPLTLSFGAPERFHGHGIFLPAVGGREGFDQLRREILGAERAGAREQVPHMTLAHPRNPQAPGNALEEGSALARGLSIRFHTACWIEQIDSEPWRVLEELSFSG